MSGPTERIEFLAKCAHRDIHAHLVVRRMPKAKLLAAAKLQLGEIILHAQVAGQKIERLENRPGCVLDLWQYAVAWAFAERLHRAAMGWRNPPPGVWFVLDADGARYERRGVKGLGTGAG